MRFDEMPEMLIRLMPSDDPPQGVGEMAGPPAAPALLNAIYDATGVHIRRLPVRSSDLQLE
jgi:isoquinoline 1-oxidoreductase beta subunit